MERALLAAKRACVELQCRREEARLCSIHRAEVTRREQVQRAEGVLWSEIARVASGSGHIGGIDRPLSAHRALSQAQQLHAQALGALKKQSRATQKAESVREQVVAMLAACRRKDIAAVESRQSEDSLEMFLTQRVLRARTRVSEGVSESLNSSASDRGLQDEGARTGVPAALNLSPRHLPEESGAQGDAGIPRTAVCQAAPCENTEGDTLKVACAHVTGGGPVSLTVSQRGSEGVSVVLRAAFPELLTMLLKERGAVVRELIRAGVQVQSVAVLKGAPENASLSTGWPAAQRRSRRRDEDEALVP